MARPRVEPREPPAAPLLPVEKPVYTLEEAATLLGMHRTTLWRHARRGALRTTRVGLKTFILRPDLEALLEAGFTPRAAAAGGQPLPAPGR